MSSTVKATCFGVVTLVVFISLLSIPYSSNIRRVFILNTSVSTFSSSSSVLHPSLTSPVQHPSPKPPVLHPSPTLPVINCLETFGNNSQTEPWFLEIEAVVNNLSRTSNDMLFPTFANLLNQTWEQNRTLLTCYREALKSSSNIVTSDHLLLTLQNIHIGQSIPTIDDNKVKPTRAMFKYFPKESPLPHPPYNSCSIVGSSAILSGSQCGSSIDDANVVFRFNLAPTVGFEKDVGKRTTMSTMNPSIFRNKFGDKKTLKNVKEFSTLLREHDNELIWTPAFAYKGNDKPTFDAIKKVREINPKLRFVLQDTRHFIALRKFWKSHGLDAMLSSGFYFISAALDICENVDAYGFWPFDKAIDDRPLTYHYFHDSITFNEHHQMSQEFAILVAMHHQGMGYYMAKSLAQLGGRVIVACRSEERATKAIEQMNKEHQEELSKQSTTSEKTKSDTVASGDDSKPDSEKAEAAATEGRDNKVQPLNLEFMKLDLGSLASVMDFVNSFKAKGYPLHTEMTEDDIEKQFQMNYLGHNLILLHLLPLIKEGGPNSRVIFVTGGAFTYKLASFKPDDLQLKKSFSNTKIVANTKLFQTMSMYAFERRTKGSQIGWFAINPGVVNTPMVQKGGSRATAFAFNSLETVRLAKSSQQGAEVMLRAILDPVYDGREALFFDHKCASNSHNPGSLAKNVEKQEVLWKLSLELLKDYVTDDLMKDLQLPADEGGEEAKGEGAKEGGGEEMKGGEETKGTEETKGIDGTKEEGDAGGAAAN